MTSNAKHTAAVFENDEMDLRENRTHYIMWYSNPRTNQHNQDLADCIGMRYLKYTKGEKIAMSLLIPDRNRENREDFVWCIPLDRVKWQKWYVLAEKFKTKTPQGVRYVERRAEKDVKTVLVMPNGQQSDEDAEVACAWLRMVKEYNCRMYVIRCTDDPLKGAALIHATAGIDGSLMEELEDEPPQATRPK